MQQKSNTTTTTTTTDIQLKFDQCWKRWKLDDLNNSFYRKIVLTLGIIITTTFIISLISFYFNVKLQQFIDNNPNNFTQYFNTSDVNHISQSLYICSDRSNYTSYYLTPYRATASIELYFIQFGFLAMCVLFIIFAMTNRCHGLISYNIYYARQNLRLEWNHYYRAYFYVVPQIIVGCFFIAYQLILLGLNYQMWQILNNPVDISHGQVICGGSNNIASGSCLINICEDREFPEIIIWTINPEVITIYRENIIRLFPIQLGIFGLQLILCGLCVWDKFWKYVIDVFCVRYCNKMYYKCNCDRRHIIREHEYIYDIHV